MKLNYKQRLLLWFGVIFLLFSAGIAVFEQSRARNYKTEALEEKLDAYAAVVNGAVEQREPIDSLLRFFPKNIRVTLVDKQGNVFYDNAFSDLEKLENHSGRQEIAAARANDRGSFVRESATNGIEYLYYAKSYGNHYVRVALPYDIQVKSFLRADNGFLYVTLLLLLIALVFINYAAGMFGKSIKQLRDFTIAAEENRLSADDEVVFPDDELGEIGKRIVRGYKELEISKKTITQEREKLLQHVQTSEEGVCFYAPDGQVEFYNGLFIQQLNILIDKTVADPDKVFESPVFAELNSFLSADGSEKYYESVIRKQGKDFAVQVNRFSDGSCEVIIRDITKQERTRQLKLEMTGNIAHELRTPVTSIRGYLETILEKPLDADKQHQFVAKAFSQTLTLSELISDMGLLTKIEDAPDSFQMDKINIRSVVDRVYEDLELQLKENEVTVNVNIGTDIIVRGNANLIYSIFRNLMDNAVKYAGKGIAISVGCYNSDRDFYYLSFSDNGTGIEDEAHLSRIFERFYRISEGRTRETGGSGLGLSIVRNAIAFHKGTISVKNRAGGGLEFLFKLPR